MLLNGLMGMFDWTFLLLIPAFIVTAVAQAKVGSTYKEYSNIRVKSGITGAQFAQEMLLKNNVKGVRIVPIAGTMTDHFDPRDDTVSLSEGVYAGSTVAAVSIAAHECGHVLQKFTGYAPMKMRSAIVPMANIASKLAFPLLLIGLLFAVRIPGLAILADVGCWLYFAAVIFQLITLPVELNASARALANIKATGVMDESELGGAKKMLKAAAMTYVAALLSSFLTFLRLLLLSRNRR